MFKSNTIIQAIKFNTMRASLSIIILSIFITLTACSQGDVKVKSQSAIDFKTTIANDSILLIDVRTVAEYSAGHIPNAINIDVNNPDFAKVVKDLITPTKSLALYCRSGRRSKLAASLLIDMSIPIYDLNNGFNEWLQSGFTVTK